ncbi:MAG: acetyl-coenzyme A synthetase N-terminal domain-containing protein, partial [Caldimonas sp.]
MTASAPHIDPRPFDWVPNAALVEASNLSAFLRQAVEPDYAALLARSEADPAWLMAQVFEFCDLRFFKPSARLLDTSDGIEWARWCAGGTTNIVL